MRKIKEVGFTKYLPFVVKKKTFKDYTASFAIKAEEVQMLNPNGEWVPLTQVHPDRESIKYSVHIGLSGGSGREINIRRDNIEDRIKVFVHTVTFSNDVTSMGDLKANIGFVVFSTVARVLNEFATTYPDKFQCFHFTPAYPELVPIYEILSKESEKQGNLIYANKSTGRANSSWYLINKKLWNKYKKIKGIE